MPRIVLSTLREKQVAPVSDLRIAVLPGDGIGVEVMDACLEVLEALAANGMSTDSVDHIIAHQATLRIIESVM